VIEQKPIYYSILYPMKKPFSLICFVVLTSLTSISCVKKGNTKETQEDQLPVESQAFLNRTFENIPIRNTVKIEHANYYNTVYSVYLDNQLKVDFDASGNWTEIEMEDHSALPESFLRTEIPIIWSYVQSHFDSLPILEIDRELTKRYEVKLSNGIGLIFDAQQNYVGIDLDKNQDEVLIQSYQLPKNSLAYLHKNFQDESIILIKKSTRTTPKEYCVYLAEGYKICFDNSGNWTDIEAKDKKGISPKLLTPALASYLENNYPEALIIEVERSDEQDEITLLHQQKELELTFDKQGNLMQ